MLRLFSAISLIIRLPAVVIYALSIAFTLYKQGKLYEVISDPFSCSFLNPEHFSKQLNKISLVIYTLLFIYLYFKYSH